MKNIPLCLFTMLIVLSVSLKLKHYHSNHKLYSTICKEIEINQCQCIFSSNNTTKFFSALSDRINFTFGEEFVDNPFTVKQLCESKCKHLNEYKPKCDLLKKEDPLYAVNDLDLTGIIINDNNSTAVKIPNEKIIKEKEDISCDCLNEKDVLSLFCQDQCKSIVEFTNRVNTYYSNLLNSTKEYFHKQKQQYE